MEKRHIVKGFSVCIVMVAAYIVSRNLISVMCVSGQVIPGVSGVMADILFQLISVLLLLGMLPRTFLCIFSGVMFPDHRAWIYVLVVSGVSSLVGYAIGGFFFRGSLENLFKKRKWFYRFREWTQNRPISTIVFIRMVVRSNFGMTNLFLGSLRFPLYPYFFGSLVSIAPATLAWVYVGQVVGCRGLSGMTHLPPEVQGKLVTAGVVLTLLGFVPLIFERWQRDR